MNMFFHAVSRDVNFSLQRALQKPMDAVSKRRSPTTPCTLQRMPPSHPLLPRLLAFQNSCIVLTQPPMHTTWVPCRTPPQLLLWSLSGMGKQCHKQALSHRQNSRRKRLVSSVMVWSVVRDHFRKPNQLQDYFHILPCWAVGIM